MNKSKKTPYPVNQGYPLPPNDLRTPAPYPTDFPQSKNLSLGNNNNELSEILNVIINSPYVTIKQDIELAEIVTGCEFRNRYLLDVCLFIKISLRR